MKLYFSRQSNFNFLTLTLTALFQIVAVVTVKYSSSCIWQVYKYDYKLVGNHSCCAEAPRAISDVFKPRTPADLSVPGNSAITYASNLDSVYYSYSTRTLYLIRGEYAWKVDGYTIPGSYNEDNIRVRYIGEWNNIWKYICGGDC